MLTKAEPHHAAHAREAAADAEVVVLQRAGGREQLLIDAGLARLTVRVDVELAEVVVGVGIILHDDAAGARELHEHRLVGLGVGRRGEVVAHHVHRRDRDVGGRARPAVVGVGARDVDLGLALERRGAAACEELLVLAHHRELVAQHRLRTAGAVVDVDAGVAAGADLLHREAVVAHAVDHDPLHGDQVVDHDARRALAHFGDGGEDAGAVVFVGLDGPIGLVGLRGLVGLGRLRLGVRVVDGVGLAPVRVVFVGGTQARARCEHHERRNPDVRPDHDDLLERHALPELPRSNRPARIWRPIDSGYAPPAPIR